MKRLLALAVAAIPLLAFTPSRAAEDVLPIYKKDAAPATPRLEDLPLKKGLSQNGITWTFDEPARVGQFITGDFYVVGPVKIREIDPRPLFGEQVKGELVPKSPEAELWADRRARNGSILNMPGEAGPCKETRGPQRTGFDSRLSQGFYDPNQFAPLPISMKPGDSLVSSISCEPMVHEYAIKSLAVLTCVAEPQPGDAFRPSFCQSATCKPYRTRELRRDLLLNLPRPETAAKLKPADYVDWYRGPWVDMGGFGRSMPPRKHPFGGRPICQYGGGTSLMLLLDYSPQEKEPLLVNMVQVGIDLYGLLRGGHEWHAEGGIYSGRKWLILFAGLLLGDTDMQDLRKSHPEGRFNEDEQVLFCPIEYNGTKYERGWTGSKVIWTGHFGYVGGRCFQSNQWSLGYGPLELFPPSEWPMPWPEGYEMYRRGTCAVWIGQALAARMMHAEKLWNYDAYFAYVDRWMTEDDAPFQEAICKNIESKARNEEGKAALLAKARAVRAGATGVPSGVPPEFAPFIREMWDKYRTDLPAAADGRKTPPPNKTWK